MECPFCDYDMVAGRIVVTWGRGQIPFAAAVWKPADPDQGSRQYVLSPGVISRQPRDASFCNSCEAVVIHPRDAGGLTIPD
jgi:hypothetical protein